MAGSEIVAFLRASPIFAGVPDREIEALGSVVREEPYRPRDYVFMEGDPAPWFCLVRTGRVKILKHSRGGRDVVLEVLGPGEPFGGVAVVEKRPYPASAQVIEASVVVKIPQAAILALAERHPSLVMQMALMIGRRLRDAHDTVKALAVNPVEARLAATLLRLGREGAQSPRGLELPFHPTRQSLADMAGTTVETTIRIVGRWLKDGLVEDHGDRFVLKDVEGLTSLAAGEAP